MPMKFFGEDTRISCPAWRPAKVRFWSAVILVLAASVVLSQAPVSQGQATVDHTGSPAIANSQVPDSVSTPQPFTGTGPSQVPSGVSTPPPFTGNPQAVPTTTGAPTAQQALAAEALAKEAQLTPPGPPPSPQQTSGGPASCVPPQPPPGCS